MESKALAGAEQEQSPGPRILVIKRGEHGALVFFEDETFAAPALPLEVVVDPTGAGDSFAGGMIGKRVEGQSALNDAVNKNHYTMPCTMQFVSIRY